MKKLLLLAGLFVPAALTASAVFVEVPANQSYELQEDVTQPISLPGGVELHVLDTGNPDASVFKLTVTRMDANGLQATLCENLVTVPFGSNVTLGFSKMGISVRLVASTPDPSITPQPPTPVSDPTNPRVEV